jgi:hypothetical protein
MTKLLLTPPLFLSCEAPWQQERGIKVSFQFVLWIHTVSEVFPISLEWQGSKAHMLSFLFDIRAAMQCLDGTSPPEYPLASEFAPTDPSDSRAYTSHAENSKLTQASPEFIGCAAIHFRGKS